MEYRSEIDSREKKSAKKRASIARWKTFDFLSPRSSEEKYPPDWYGAAAPARHFLQPEPPGAVVLAALPPLDEWVPVRYFWRKHPQIFPNFL
ncbi:hypothetical protein [Burkholderia stagnalis]|uniref:hypothetical protein n=1 Tax=Burkholderia stagnalis TaxID=1503054 RepID=UPI00158BBEC7|nr:hypothetical protein [Burkholderia stagnalis]